MNYTITTQWKSLSQIMGNDYDNTKQYRVHDNVELPAILCMSEDAQPEGEGRKLPEFAEVYIEAGLNPSFKVQTCLGLQSGFNIYVSEVA